MEIFPKPFFLVCFWFFPPQHYNLYTLKLVFNDGNSLHYCLYLLHCFYHCLFFFSFNCYWSAVSIKTCILDSRFCTESSLEPLLLVRFSFLFLSLAFCLSAMFLVCHFSDQSLRLTVVSQLTSIPFASFALLLSMQDSWKVMLTDTWWNAVHSRALLRGLQILLQCKSPRGDMSSWKLFIIKIDKNCKINIITNLNIHM